MGSHGAVSQLVSRSVGRSVGRLVGRSVGQSAILISRKAVSKKERKEYLLVRL
jgi:tetrahydromethanopterin S-methyltransferase subunit G